ncbi:hypothetical protein BH24ACT5_BH24ACT5_21690 [soil metagenome]
MTTARGSERQGDTARSELVALLQLAHSGELAAAHAYEGHARSVRRPEERARINEIRDEEIDHRARVRAMLDALGVQPEARRERKLRRVGKLIGAFCRVGGWYAPMYGAARLERKNIDEYARAARFAFACGHTAFIDDLVDMSEVEWDHERYFREQCEGHWLWRFSPRWPAPPPRTEIRTGVDHSASLRSPATQAGVDHSASLRSPATQAEGDRSSAGASSLASSDDDANPS